MNVRTLLFTLFLASFINTSNAKIEVPDNVIRLINNSFPQCDLSTPVTGSLYGESSSDIAVVVGCKSSKNDYSSLQLILVLTKDSDGKYFIASKTGKFDTDGIYDLSLEIKKNSLFIHISIPGSQTAIVTNYQFKKIGKDLTLIGMETQSYYHGDAPQDKSTEDFHISTNYLTGVVLDSRHKAGKSKKVRLKKIQFQEFFPGIES
ncbi:hypothetical protein [Undibacterium flavidum]|uniref:Uncharacterized protein n=1 Tax=Undibacterium flavidum TaxID=2762297 RepID=A0ABR6YEZ9_9BURK|nr:hypothetical protein [Undibacterium flavidum]MBC3875088.1 hypothetical protein [Undibacterium flavidum]